LSATADDSIHLKLEFPGDFQPKSLKLYFETLNESIDLINTAFDDKAGVRVAEYWLTMSPRYDLDTMRFIVKNDTVSYYSNSIHLIVRGKL